MTLALDTALRGVADVLRDRVAPTLTDDYAVEAVRLSTMMLRIMANAADDAVALRVDENARFRALLGDSVAIVEDAALRERLAEAAASRDPGLRISELDRETDRLRRVLVALQVALEARNDAAARELDERIWRLLRDIEVSRAPQQ